MSSTGLRTTPITEVAARLRLAVGRLSRRLRQRDVDGLTPSQLSALSSIERLGPIRLSDLAAHEGVAAPTLTRIMGCLESAGHVERQTDPADGRCSLMSLSPHGRDALSAVRRERTALLVQRLDRLEPSDLATLVAALPVLESLVEDEGGWAARNSG